MADKGVGKGADKGFWGFVWDSESKAFMGRTGSSWLKIFVFYTILYVFLAMFFFATIRILLFTLSDSKPTYQDRVERPGLSHTPRSEKEEISFNMNKPDTYEKYTNAIKDLLASYEDGLQTEQLKYMDCGGEAAAGPSDRANEDGEKKACKFYKSWLKECSGSKDDNTFGFRDGKPCLIVKFNRVVGYTPTAPKKASLPEALQENFEPNRIPIHCTSKIGEDKGKIVAIKYFGFDGGFPLQYYPYYGKKLHPQYLQPLVGIQFDMNQAMNELVHMECKVFGEDIDYNDKDRYQGRFDVKLRVSNE